MVLVASHEVEVGRRQHRDRHPGVGEAAGNGVQRILRDRRELGDVADGDAPAVAELLGLRAHVLDVHGLRRVAEVEMHVDVDVELARHLEHAVDLAARIGVGVGGAGAGLGVATTGASSFGGVYTYPVRAVPPSTFAASSLAFCNAWSSEMPSMLTSTQTVPALNASNTPYPGSQVQIAASAKSGTSFTTFPAT